jgi:hypothetical protein
MMPLTAEDIKSLNLGVLGMPVVFQGDRLDAFRLGINIAVEALKDKVSMDKPKEEGKK